MVTMRAIIHELADVGMPIRASVFGSVWLERFRSWWRRISHLDCHRRHMMSQFGLITT
jgi:hypothetical protein